MNCAEKLFRGQIEWPHQPGRMLGYIRDIRSSVFIDAQPVHDWLNDAIKSKELQEEDFPESLCPFGQCVLFFTEPKAATSVAVVCFPGLWSEIRDAVGDWTSEITAEHGMLAELWISGQGHLAMNPGIAVAAHDSSGSIAAFRAYYTGHGWKADIGLRMVQQSGTLALAAFCFANCKNVSIEEAPISRQVRRRAKRMGEPIFRHHQIRIEPLRTLLAKEGGLAQHGDIKRALHICRGHFSSYGDKYGRGKLFGKLEGRFWISKHVRGTVDAGAVTKDYVVGAKA